MERLNLPLELKEVSEQGKFSGIASVYGAVDLGGDVVERGAFSKSLAERPTVPILWQHRMDEVIGEGKLRSTHQGLSIDGLLDIDIDPTAQKAYGKMKRGRVTGLSIGFQTDKEEMKNGIRHLQEIKLWEVSVVTFPMLPAAQITSVKSLEEIEEYLEEFWLQRDGVKAAIAQSPELKQRFLSLLGEAGTGTPEATSTKGADESTETAAANSVVLARADSILALLASRS